MVGQREGAARAGGLGRPIEEIVAAARRRLHRLHPVAACAAMQGGAILVDIRPRARRLAEGRVPGALRPGDRPVPAPGVAAQHDWLTAGNSSTPSPWAWSPPARSASPQPSSATS